MLGVPTPSYLKPFVTPECIASNSFCTHTEMDPNSHTHIHFRILVHIYSYERFIIRKTWTWIAVRLVCTFSWFGRRKICLNLIYCIGIIQYGLRGVPGQQQQYISLSYKSYPSHSGIALCIRMRVDKEPEQCKKNVNKIISLLHQEFMQRVVAMVQPYIMCVCLLYIQCMNIRTYVCPY